MDEQKFLDYAGLKRVIDNLKALGPSISVNIPLKTIVLWSGKESEIPRGWTLCNGENGSPDLRGKFILATSEDHPIGEEGGSDTASLRIESTEGGSLFNAGDEEIASEISVMPPYYVLAYIMKISADETDNSNGETGGGTVNLMAGSGLEIEDNIINIKNPVQGIMTHVEYEMLDGEVKNKGTYILSNGDEDGDLASNIYEIISNGVKVTFKGTDEEKIKAELAKKQNILTPDKSIIIENDNIKVSSPNHNILTKAEYDALNPEEKGNGVYFVDDEDGVALMDSNIYSTEETIVGRWIDGKPIYRRVFKTVTPNTASATIDIGLTKDVEFIVNYHGVITQKDGSFLLLPFINLPANAYVNVTISKDRSAVFRMSNEYVSLPIVLVYEYTKTTDSAITNLPVVSSSSQNDKVLTPNLTPSKSGKVEVDGVEYDYEMPDSSFAWASASASSVNFSFASASSADFSFKEAE